MMKALIGSRVKVIGQQHRDGQRRADAGQHADGGAERHAGERPHQVAQVSAFANPREGLQRLSL